MFHLHIRQRMHRLGIKNGDFAALVGVSAPAMSNFLKGRKELDSRRIDQVLAELEKLKRSFPIPLGMTNPKLLALSLERFRDGKFAPFLELTRSIDWRPSREDVGRLRRHYPALWKKKKGDTCIPT